MHLFATLRISHYKITIKVLYKYLCKIQATIMEHKLLMGYPASKDMLYIEIHSL